MNKKQNKQQMRKRALIKDRNIWKNNTSKIEKRLETMFKNARKLLAFGVMKRQFGVTPTKDEQDLLDTHYKENS